MKKMKTITVALALTAALVLGGCSANTSSNEASKAKEVKVYKGMGQDSVFRARTKEGKKIYSTSTVNASALFDESGKIIDVQFDTLELVQNGEGEKAAVFPGWPNETITEDTAKKDVANWYTKRERGDAAYGMNWSEQIDLYQDFFKGKTVAEVEAWYAKNTSDINGKPLSDKLTDPKDVEKFGKLTADEKKALADVTSGASISLNDAHGNFIKALKEAFENKIEVTIK